MKSSLRHPLLLLILLLCLIPLCGVAKDTSFFVHGSLAANRVDFEGMITNYIKVSCQGGPALSELVCKYPNDPGIYGLDVVSVFYKEKLVFDGGALSRKDFLLTYVFKPKFVGIIGVGPVKIDIISIKNNRTNTIYSAKKKIEVVGPTSISFIWYIIVIVILGSVALYFVRRWAIHRSLSGNNENNENN